MVVRCRTGTFTRGVWNDPECGAPLRRCTASGKRTIAILNVSVAAEGAMNFRASRQLALRAEDCTARARQLASALAKALGRVFS
jgi:hypothetical protein